MERVYPKEPLEMPIEHEQLLAAAPPSYDQATATPAQTTGPAPSSSAAAAAAVSPAATSGQHTVIVLPPTPFGPHPQDVQCPYCHNYTRTRVSYNPNSRTHLTALVLCLLGLYCCVCVPYCITSCMSTNHYCGLCDRYLGTHSSK